MDVAYLVRDLNMLSLGRAVLEQWSECPDCEYHVSLVPNGHYEQLRGHASRLATEANLIITNAMPAQRPSTSVVMENRRLGN